MIRHLDLSGFFILFRAAVIAISVTFCLPGCSDSGDTSGSLGSDIVAFPTVDTGTSKIDVTPEVESDAGPVPVGGCETDMDCSGQQAPSACLEPACNQETGGCIFTAVLTGTPCDDHDGCTKSTICSNGECVGGQPIDCADEEPCTVDSCTGDGNCQHVLDPFCCTPECEGTVCGPNGCGGTCGDCPQGTACGLDGLCEVSCTAACDGKVCGDDGCGDTCGACPGGLSCNAAGLCVDDGCTANCQGKVCGDDGCGGSCGPACGPGQSCQGGQCVQGGCDPVCDWVECGDDGCGGSCGTCGFGQECQAGVCVADGGGGTGTCAGQCGDSAQDGSCYCDSGCMSFGDCCSDYCDHCSALNPNACGGCEGSCVGKTCGDDGCGGSCGSCGAGLTCVSGNCKGQPGGGSSCAEPLTLTLDQASQQDTTGSSDDFAFAKGTCPDLTTANDPGGADQVFNFTAPASGNYTFELDVIDSVWLNLFVVRDCANAEDTAVACFGDSTIFNEEINVWIEAGESVAAIVDSDTWGSTDTGAYTLKVSEYDACPWADCDGKTCGDDGCNYGAVCGQCSGTDACNSSNQCVQPGAGDSCESPLTITGDLPVTLSGSTQDPGTTNYFSYAEDMCLGNLNDTEGNSAVDQVWAFQPKQSGNYTFEIDTWESFSGIITYLMGSCDSEAMGCLAGLPYYDSDPLTAYLLGNKTYNLVVDGYDGSSSSDGEYQFTVDEYQECFSADCAGKQCGDNGCNEGALCGVCTDGDVCGAGTCFDADEGNTCADAFYVSVSVTEPYLSNHDNSYATNNYKKAYGDCSEFSLSTGSEGEDQAFYVSFEDPGTYRITVTPLDSWYAAIYVLEGSCSDLESDCIATDVGSKWTGATVDVQVSAFESLYVIVDGDTDNDWIIENGPYTFEVEALP
jgi:hypothetical protein